MDFESLRQLAEKVELLVARDQTLRDENSDLREVLEKKELEVAHLARMEQRLEKEKKDLTQSSGNPEQVRLLRERLEALLKRLKKHNS